MIHTQKKTSELGSLKYQVDERSKLFRFRSRKRKQKVSKLSAVFVSLELPSSQLISPFLSSGFCECRAGDNNW